MAGIETDLLMDAEGENFYFQRPLIDPSILFDGHEAGNSTQEQNVVEPYKKFELIVLGGGSLQDGVNRVSAAYEEVREAGRLPTDFMVNPRRLFQDELTVLSSSFPDKKTH